MVGIKNVSINPFFLDLISHAVHIDKCWGYNDEKGNATQVPGVHGVHSRS